MLGMYKGTTSNSTTTPSSPPTFQSTYSHHQLPHSLSWTPDRTFDRLPADLMSPRESSPQSTSSASGAAMAQSSSQQSGSRHGGEWATTPTLRPTTASSTVSSTAVASPEMISLSTLLEEKVPSPPASLTDIIARFNKEGNGDRQLLLAILSAKQAEEERLSRILETRLSLIQMHARRQGFALQGDRPMPRMRNGQPVGGCGRTWDEGCRRVPPRFGHEETDGEKGSEKSFFTAATGTDLHRQYSRGRSSARPHVDDGKLPNEGGKEGDRITLPPIFTTTPRSHKDMELSDPEGPILGSAYGPSSGARGGAATTSAGRSTYGPSSPYGQKPWQGGSHHHQHHTEHRQGSPSNLGYNRPTPSISSMSSGGAMHVDRMISPVNLDPRERDNYFENAGRFRSLSDAASRALDSDIGRGKPRDAGSALSEERKRKANSVDGDRYADGRGDVKKHRGEELDGRQSPIGGSGLALLLDAAAGRGMAKPEMLFV